MNISKAEILEMVKYYLPVVKELVPEIQELGTDLKPLAESYSKMLVEANARNFKAYQDAGFTRGESMLLLLNSKVALQQALDNFGKNVK